MKQFILITTLVLIQSSSFGQNLFFIGNNAYPCTETFTLKSNSKFQGYDLDVLIAKDNQKGLLALSTQVMGGGIRIKGQTIIYLDDGSVITCFDNDIYDFVDNVATTVYYLTGKEIEKIKNSNINTIRFSLKCYNCSMSTEEGDFSASNKDSGYGHSKKERTNVPSLVAKLWKSPPAQNVQSGTEKAKPTNLGSALRYIGENLEIATFSPIRKEWKYDYGFKDGWLLNKFEYIRSLLTYMDFQAILDYPIYLSGPHTNGELDLNSKYSFGHYNPKFVSELRLNASSLLSNRVFVNSTKHLFEKHGVIEFLIKNKNVYEITQKYPNDFNEIKSQFIWGLENKTWQEDGYRVFLPQVLYTDYYLNWSETSYYFWIRRDIDNTKDIWIGLINDVLNAYGY